MAPDLQSPSLPSVSEPFPPVSSRRRLLQLGGLAAASCLLPRLTWAYRQRPAPSVSAERALSFYNLHTGENLQTVYWQDGTYVPEALADIDHILRDHRTDDTVAIDLGLLNLLYALRQTLETEQPFHIISGYRSPKTNEMLRRETEGVDKRSLHMQGRAIDIRVPARRSRVVRQAALRLNRGGVGYYPRSDFVHVDTGHVRQW